MSRKAIKKMSGYGELGPEERREALMEAESRAADRELARQEQRDEEAYWGGMDVP